MDANGWEMEMDATGLVSSFWAVKKETRDASSSGLTAALIGALTVAIVCLTKGLQACLIADSFRLTESIRPSDWVVDVVDFVS